MKRPSRQGGAAAHKMRFLLHVPFVLALAIGPLALADPREQGPADSSPSGLLAGVARVEISPSAGIPHMNWGSATHLVAEGVASPGLFATALVLSDGKQKFAIVDIDAVNVNGLDSVITRAERETGIPAAHIRLAASHTHAGPNLSVERAPIGADMSALSEIMRRYRESLDDKLVGVIVAATRRLEPVHLYAGRGTGTINVNRRFRRQGSFPPAVGRNPDGFVDRELVVIRIDRADGTQLAVIGNFQCHGTVLGFENKQVSADWIGHTRATVEAAFPGALCLFFQGAAGNQGPVEGFSGDDRVAKRLGATLGHQIAAVALDIETVRREPVFDGYIESTAYQARQYWRVKGPRDSTLRFASRLIPVAARTYSEAEIAEMQSRVEEAKTSLEAARRSGDAWKRAQAEARLRRFSNLLEKWKGKKSAGAQVLVNVQLLRIGDVAILSMPGEPFGEIGAELKKLSPFRYTMFCGYSSGQGGDYMPTQAEYDHGGYEVERTPYGRTAARELITEAAKLYSKVQ